jgi:muconolactone D-isomerase
MEFLVRLDNELPPDTPTERRDELKAAERQRAEELRREGILIRLWRVPGTRQALGLFAADDPTQLHDALASLPLFPWQRIEVEALATHPQEAD